MSGTSGFGVTSKSRIDLDRIRVNQVQTRSILNARSVYSRAQIAARLARHADAIRWPFESTRRMPAGIECRVAPTKY